MEKEESEENLLEPLLVPLFLFSFASLLITCNRLRNINTATTIATTLLAIKKQSNVINNTLIAKFSSASLDVDAEVSNKDTTYLLVVVTNDNWVNQNRTLFLCLHNNKQRKREKGMFIKHVCVLECMIIIMTVITIMDVH